MCSINMNFSVFICYVYINIECSYCYIDNGINKNIIIYIYYVKYLSI